MIELIQKIKSCEHCIAHLPLGANPILKASKNAKIVIVGQAPGIRVHKSGIPWNDPSGIELRRWMNLDESQFYDDDRIAIVPMGFCYPGVGVSGDLPPRKECAPLWHKLLFEEMPDIELIMLIGQYAQKYYLGNDKGINLTERVRNYMIHTPKYFPLPHPSPRNRIWMKKNPWFELEVVPILQRRIESILI